MTDSDHYDCGTTPVWKITMRRPSNEVITLSWHLAGGSEPPTAEEIAALYPGYELISSTRVDEAVDSTRRNT